MLHLIPAPLRPLLRPGYRLAHRLRDRWRRWRRVPLAGVCVIAVDGAGRLLLVRLSYAEAGWSLPGGGANRGEPMATAAARELAEETGCMARGVTLVGCLHETLSGSPHTTHVFACRVEGQARADGAEVVEAGFFRPDALPRPLTPRTSARLALWRRRRVATQAGSEQAELPAGRPR